MKSKISGYELFFIVILLFLFQPFAFSNTIVIATGEWPPYCSEGIAGKGFTSEIISQAFKEVDIDVTLEFKPWKRCQYEVVNGLVFAAFPYFKTPEREIQAWFSDPIASSKYVFFYKKDVVKKNLEFSSINELKPYRLGGILGFFYEETFKKLGLKIDFAPSVDMCFKKLYHGRLDLMPEDELVGWAVIKRLFPGKEHLFATTTNGLLKNDQLYLMTSKKRKKAGELLQQFNIGLKKLKSKGLYKKIMDKYK